MKKILIIIAVLLFLQASAQGYRSCEDKQLLVSKLSHICKYPIKLQASNQEAIVAIEYKTDNKGNVVKRKVVDCNNKKFKSATLEAFDKVKNRKHLNSSLFVLHSSLNQGTSTLLMMRLTISSLVTLLASAS